MIKHLLKKIETSLFIIKEIYEYVNIIHNISFSFKVTIGNYYNTSI